jgi:diguanylate cyclase (GGDEF)-like protein
MTEQNKLVHHNARTVVVYCDKSSHTVVFAEKYISQEFQVVLIEDSQNLFQAVAEHEAQLVVIDLKMNEGRVVDELVFASIKASKEVDTSLLFVSALTDMDTRLAAVRVGGDAFVVAPFEQNELMDTVDRLMDTGMKAPIRVLIVEDNDEFINITSRAIEDAGMMYKVARNPVETQNALTSFVPELILMDITMPDCTGQELSDVILQQEQYVGTPVIFLSEERRQQGRIDDVRNGSYNFMAKPVDITKLTGMIREQALKYRSMRSRMVKDSLTGLNNHSMTRRLLERQIDNARRMKSPLSFAMIDIDHFKRVNDTYGHAMGDQVLRSLSRLLKQRFRSNDVVGRLGGEEFGIVISGTDAKISKTICDQVRVSFSDLQFGTGDEKFSCEFSTGIAEFPICDTSSEIMEAADKALYEAKRSGRNQVVLSSLDTKFPKAS